MRIVEGDIAIITCMTIRVDKGNKSGCVSLLLIHSKYDWYRSGHSVMYCQLPPSVSPLFSVRRQDVWPKHTHSEAQRGHQPVEKLPDPDGA